MAEALRDGETRAGEAVTLSAYLGGRVKLYQPRRGHRAGSDALLLAAGAPADVGGIALDVGAGVGAAGLSLAAMRPGLAIGLVENDPVLAALARRNLVLNEIAEAGRVYEADFLDPQSRKAAQLADGLAELVISNPPFLDAKRIRLSPDAGRRSAHVLSPGVSLEKWMISCFTLLAEGGILVMIHRPDALSGMLAACEGRAGDINLMPVHPRAGKLAIRILLRARKGARGALTIASPLILHRDDRFTPEVEAIHRGEALISW